MEFEKKHLVLLALPLFLDSGNDPGLGREELLCRNTELKKTSHGAREILEPQILAISIRLRVLLERLVLNEDIVGAMEVVSSAE